MGLSAVVESRLDASGLAWHAGHRRSSSVGALTLEGPLTTCAGSFREMT